MWRILILLICHIRSLLIVLGHLCGHWHVVLISSLIWHPWINDLVFVQMLAIRFADSSGSSHASLRLLAVVLWNFSLLRWAWFLDLIYRWFLSRCWSLMSGPLFLLLRKRTFHLEHTHIILLLNLLLSSVHVVLSSLDFFHVANCLLIDLELVISQDIWVKKFFQFSYGSIILLPLFGSKLFDELFLCLIRKWLLSVEFLLRAHIGPICILRLLVGIAHSFNRIRFLTLVNGHFFWF